MKKLLSSLVVFSAVAIAPALYATPIHGQFSVTGASVQDTGTQLVFSPNTINVGAQIRSREISIPFSLLVRLA